MTSFNSIPNTPHLAIISTTTIYIPGDERSRTNPGHGYPESTETVITYEVFTDRKKWEEEIQRRVTSPYSKAFKAVEVKPAEITTTVSVTVK